ncbi:polyketide cyclase/dehydrase family protein [Candidatus Blochmanniella vafra str. BVAF]|uniref:Polyketide cyclase/dehydrase family protein n=1 Tax=Blochmanniella vafra (strain BVAF) TaxID=859654 RepID=E8Q6G2_BLOVB|nr:type II toxin-antitoxin system RatA family toxin [Candidatus Blochmannia vafer]ADV33931.1 polyketide cyclase/dehydrase family protein [Candidatus Blochmannia vafer str. BVAF]
MCYVKCLALVPYSVEQMFCLINDVGAYTEFIPGCNLIHVIQQSDTELIAEIHFTVSGVKQSVITHNFFTKNKSIIIYLINSPFKSFYGCWQFVPVTNVICKIEYISYYEFKSVLFKKFFNYSFQKVYKNIIKIFILRAKNIYSCF